MTATARRADVTLADRYVASSGPILLSGIQALVRLGLDLRRLDHSRGHDTGVFISGYPGSPLGGLDLELQRVKDLLDPAGIVFAPGLNEELAATAVGGTQLLAEVPGRRKQGVTGFWYGKNPGLDRAADAIRHSNLSGTAPLGGAVALIGDDPASKSSTVPSSCEPTCRSLMVPLLAPGNVAEVLELGLHAVAISRHAGLWTALKLVADTADSSTTVEAGEALDAIPDLPIRDQLSPPVLLPPSNLDAEADLLTTRLERVREYAIATSLNSAVFNPRRPRIGIVAAGVAFQAVLRALDDIAVGEPALEAAGIRLIKLGMPWPLDAGVLADLTAGLETVLVVEDKLPFVESQLREALYGRSHQPLIVGKHDSLGRPLLPANGQVGADDVADALVTLLADSPLPEPARQQLDARGLLRQLSPVLSEPGEPRRTPYFCSGCPHNVSTRVGAEQLVGAGIGCHTMVALDRSGSHGQILGMPQMGGEGAQWIGLAPFCDEPHFLQNLGDGTFHHSGSLAIRAASAAGVNITYRLLYNDAVAMTGGQAPQGRLPVPALVSELALEGVRQIVITTPEPERYRGVKLDPVASVRHRDDLQSVLRELAVVPGVTVMIHDDRCATEKRRMRKRGLLETPAERPFINERVCEGCGDCGEKSNCLSVHPVQTEFGRKTRIHQGSCNQDFTCLDGDCPSFMVITPKARREPAVPVRRTPPAAPSDLPDPEPLVGDAVLIRMPGIGGTGVLTVSAILQMAAHVQGLHAAGLEQTGLAQKGGPVISDVRISPAPISGQLRATLHSVDVLIGLDLLGAAEPPTIAALDRERTIAILNSDLTPTAAMVTDPDAPAPSAERLIGRVRRHSRAATLFTIPAQTISERLFGDHLPVNMLLLGAAFQHGCLPLQASAIERAIELNGTAVERNIEAFRWGRASAASPALLERAMAPAGAEKATSGHDPHVMRILETARVPARLRDVVARRAGELIAYQDAGYAATYARAVASVAEVEQRQLDGLGAGIAEAHALGLFKLMAYKDEYEVARLHLDAVERARLEDQFGSGIRVQTLLHPPFLRRLGLRRKLKFGRSANPLFKALRATRRLRGTALDPFGHTEVRRAERALIDEYRRLLDGALTRLTPATQGIVAEIAALPHLVRGYEQIKLHNVARMRERASALTAQLDAAATRSDSPTYVVAA